MIFNIKTYCEHLCDQIMNVEYHHCLLTISCISMVHNTSLCAFYMQDKDEQFHNCAEVAT